MTNFSKITSVQLAVCDAAQSTLTDADYSAQGGEVVAQDGTSSPKLWRNPYERMAVGALYNESAKTLQSKGATK